MPCLNDDERLARELWQTSFDIPDPRVTLSTASHADARSADQKIPTRRPTGSIVRTAGLKYLSAIINDLNLLNEGDEFDEVGRLRPTEKAFNLANSILIDAGITAAVTRAAGIPSAFVSTDPEGGVRVEWIRPGAKVFLVVPSNAENAYVYKEVGKGFETYEATADDLSNALAIIS